MRRKIFIFIALWSSVTFALSDENLVRIAARIAPVGQVNIEKAPPMSTTVAPITSQDMSAGQKTYEKYCTVCHQNGLAGAPKFRDAADWQARIDAKNNDELAASAIKGLNAMPPKGSCSDCSDDVIKAAIEYMLPQR